MPFSMVTALYGGWVLGDVACQINGFFNALFIGASVHTLMYISIHKYFSIKNVFKAILTTRHILGMMAATWLWGLLFAAGLITGWTSIVYKTGTTQVNKICTYGLTIKIWSFPPMRCKYAVQTLRLLTCQS